ncbi:MAG: hypothetical protein PVH99_05570 [Desulfobacteraceae bacterium]|jgi:hypothetical protein
MHRDEISLESPIDAKIAWAEKRYHEVKGELRGDQEIPLLLDKLKGAIHASHKEMAEAGVVNECRDCEEREGGSCCGSGLENRYDGSLLLINLLLGVKLPRQGYDPSSCFFLGAQGCLLLARHVICVNYLCKKITERIDAEKIAALQEKEGVELERLFHLQEKIKEKIR